MTPHNGSLRRSGAGGYQLPAIEPLWALGEFRHLTFVPLFTSSLSGITVRPDSTSRLHSFPPSSSASSNRLRHQAVNLDSSQAPVESDSRDREFATCVAWPLSRQRRGEHHRHGAVITASAISGDGGRSPDAPLCWTAAIHRPPTRSAAFWQPVRPRASPFASKATYLNRRRHQPHQATPRRP